MIEEEFETVKGQELDYVFTQVLEIEKAWEIPPDRETLKLACAFSDVPNTIFTMDSAMDFAEKIDCLTDQTQDIIYNCFEYDTDSFLKDYFYDCKEGYLERKEMEEELRHLP